MQASQEVGRAERRGLCSENPVEVLTQIRPLGEQAVGLFDFSKNSFRCICSLGGRKTVSKMEWVPVTHAPAARPLGSIEPLLYPPRRNQVHPGSLCLPWQH